MHPIKLAISRYFTALSIPIFGWSGFLDQQNGYFDIAVVNYGTAVTSIVVFVITKLTTIPGLFLYFPPFALVTNLIVMAATQLDRADNLIWIPIFPLLFIFFLDLYKGLVFCAIGAIALVIGYLYESGLVNGVVISADTMMQLALVYASSTLLGTVYERARINNEGWLIESAEIDSLTQLPNRRGIDRIVRRIMNTQHFRNDHFSIIIIDLDDFKHINDSHGHDAGDHILKTVAAHLRTNMRTSDELGRWGGEEFVAILPATDVEGALILANKLRDLLHEIETPLSVKITASFGVTAQLAGESFDDMFRRSDNAMYMAKRNGKDQVIRASEFAETTVSTSST